GPRRRGQGQTLWPRGLALRPARRPPRRLPCPGRAGASKLRKSAAASTCTPGQAWPRADPEGKFQRRPRRPPASGLRRVQYPGQRRHSATDPTRTIPGRSGMRTLILVLTSVLLLSPFTADAQGDRPALEAVAKALGATGLKSIEIQGGGTFFWAGQSYTAGMAGPQFNVRNFTRVVNYDTAAHRVEMVLTRTQVPRND